MFVQPDVLNISTYTPGQVSAAILGDGRWAAPFASGGLLSLNVRWKRFSPNNGIIQSHWASPSALDNFLNNNEDGFTNFKINGQVVTSTSNETSYNVADDLP